MDPWLLKAKGLGSLEYKALDSAVAELDACLTLRTHLVGPSWTLADVIIWATLRGNRVAAAVIRRYTNVARWYDYLDTLAPRMNTAISDLYTITNRRRATQHSAAPNSITNVQLNPGGCVTRFPPEPSGYLHIGHAKAALLNGMHAHDQPNGTLICRFDDTNPSKGSQEYQNSILEDLSALGINPDRVIYSSDYFQEMYEACKGLIRSGFAYAENTDAETMKEQGRDGVASKCRGMGTEETLARFENMRLGADAGQPWCIRAKISVDDANKCLRDPVIYRCNLQIHHRKGSTWKMYPTYDFCAPFVDALEGVTLALRTTEYNDRNAQY